MTLQLQQLERSLFLRSANIFCERGPNAAAAVPIALRGLDFVDPPGNPRTLRFASAMQVGNWIGGTLLLVLIHTSQSQILS